MFYFTSCEQLMAAVTGQGHAHSAIFFCRCTGTAAATQELLFVVKSSDLTETSQLGSGYNDIVLSALTGISIARGLVQPEESVAHHHELFLQEIEAVDEYWGPTFRGVYESGDHEGFLERLEQRIKKHDGDIEKMCSHHYQGFIDSVRDLLRVRSDASLLKQEVYNIDQEVRTSCIKLIQGSEKLVKARTVEANISSTISALSLCLPVLQMFAKLSKQMREKKYHPALKTLEQLEQTHLPRIANYRFSKQMREQIPKLRESIKEASMRDLKDFLENIRKYSSKMGEIAMRHAAELIDLDDGTVSSPSKPRQPEPNPFTGEIEYEALSESQYSAEEELSAPDLVDFSPVYRCLHIYTVLGEREIYERYYRKQRAQQSALTLQPPNNMHEEIDGYRTYFHGIVGFFVCEDHILNTGGGLVSRGYLEEVWSGALTKIVITLRTNSAYCTEAATMLKIKNLIMLFASTLRSYGYTVDKLYQLLQELRDHYNEVLMQRWVSRFRDIFDSDNYHPIQVTTPVEYEMITSSFPYHSSALDLQEFPKQFPFSAMVPRVYTEVKEFIISCLEFSRDLQLTQTDLDETVRRSTNLLLTRTLSGCLSSLIRKSGLSLLQLIQIVINTVHLEDTNIYLEDYITEVTEVEDINQVARLQARSMFKDIRAEAEEHIYKKLVSKMDEFLELANYDWMLSEPRGTASPWLMDLIAFLKSIFDSFTNLPTRLAQMCCMTSCQHLARSIMNMMTSDSLKSITTGALGQLDLDLCQCETFAVSEPVPGLEEGILLMCFSDLRQLLDLFVAWDWATYFADFGKPEKNKYQRVQPATALLILDKLREADKKSMFGNISLNKKERDKVKLLEVVTKQLKGLVVQTSS
ncbi:exocyst complex component 6B [Eurytemora carolleeae]|uniref:exocyst complex component 6B n=1 Tax=Eurytemora carolleeae TaxID=1294199 RepID=UPI000C77C0C8|nr:exocyst complex component 6B [Eurytemora carolleeae]|eukprot:XP_023341493.1 exocyst complex component 6B-like [Eurytemora affinis]